MRANWISNNKVGFFSLHIYQIFSSSFDDREQVGDLVWENESTVIIKYYDTMTNKYKLITLQKP